MQAIILQSEDLKASIRIILVTLAALLRARAQQHAKQIEKNVSQIY